MPVRTVCPVRPCHTSHFTITGACHWGRSTDNCHAECNSGTSDHGGIDAFFRIFRNCLFTNVAHSCRGGGGSCNKLRASRRAPDVSSRPYLHPHHSWMYLGQLQLPAPCWRACLCTRGVSQRRPSHFIFLFTWPPFVVTYRQRVVVEAK